MKFIIRSGISGLGYFKKEVFLLKNYFYNVKSILLYRGGNGGGFFTYFSLKLDLLIAENGGNAFINRDGSNGINGLLGYCVLSIFFFNDFLIFIFNYLMLLRECLGGKSSYKNNRYIIGESSQILFISISNILLKYLLIYICYVFNVL